MFLRHLPRKLVFNKKIIHIAHCEFIQDVLKNRLKLFRNQEKKYKSINNNKTNYLI